jgi:hypothetical protein
VEAVASSLFVIGDDYCHAAGVDILVLDQSLEVLGVGEPGVRAVAQLNSLHEILLLQKACGCRGLRW